MRGIERRLQKLGEVFHIDPSGCTPHSPEWLAYWDRQVERHIRGESGVRLTLEAVRAWAEGVPDGDEYNSENVAW